MSAQSIREEYAKKLGGKGSGHHGHSGGTGPGPGGSTARRIAYIPTKNQERKWAKFADIEMPTDDEFKARAKKSRKPWGILKKNFVLGKMTQTREYQTGIWQGRVDKARGLKYSEERSENTYNLGYYRGYTGYESDRRGWDTATRQRFNEKYVEVA